MRQKTNKCIICGKLICSSSVRCKKCANTGKENPNWLGGLDKEKYKEGFNDELRDSIRYRDKFSCQICGQRHITKQNILDVHHIDYDKQNNRPTNLAALCHPCHIKTNYDREKWITYFKNKWLERGLIRDS